ncbi:DUF1365 domain-containing protein [Devosia sp.]|uniref:DUF1365 domain-containing protein n=1 Tax=Devosia sp. TaxID=1871048 RepID=UPI00262235D0|nr:DUF1365 domain-containing protein [Devosia sp.]
MTSPIVEDIGCVYIGDVVHKRARPKKHELRYRVFSMLLDVDRLESLDEKLRLFSLNRFNFVSLFIRDFGPRNGTSIGEFIRHKARASGVTGIARIRMLAYPRIFGYAFNPITVYFCEDAEGVVRCLVHEVSNTFGEHHFYVSAVSPAVDGKLHHQARKAFYVSPFNTMEGNYRFSVLPPGDSAFVGITLSTGEGALLTAWFKGERRPLTDSGLAKLLLAYPFLTAKVVLGIHWEAMKLLLKGLPLTLKLRRRLQAGRPLSR